MRPVDLLWLIVALPFLGALLNGLVVSHRRKKLVTTVALGAPGLSLVVALAAIWQYASELAPKPFEQVLYAWSAGPLAIPVAFLHDPMSWAL